MNKPANKTFLKPISSGIFIASIILLIFSSLFSYQQEVGTLTIGLLVLSLLLIGKSLNAKNNYFYKLFIFVIPLFFSFILIKGDGRSWFLILLVVLTAWLIFFNKTNDAK